MRPAANDRVIAEDQLEAEGWVLVSLRRFSGNERQCVDMLKWCEDCIGPGRVEIESNRINTDDKWYSYSWFGFWNFWFQHEQDATAFSLRWL
jgi:hypothetical protein